MIDFLTCESHFLTHAAPVWAALPADVRDLARVTPDLMDQASRVAIVADAIDADRLRRSTVPPKAQPGDGPTALVASIGDIKVGRRLGYRRFVLMQHGAGQSYGGERGSAATHPSYPGGIDNEDVGLFLVPNEHSADRWRRAYPPASVAIVGCPKLDTLPAREPGPGPVIAVTFHWPVSLVPETLPALADFGPALPALAKRFKVIGHAHPRFNLERQYRALGIEYVRDFDEVCGRADVLAFDNTSAGFEFAATGRPVVVMNARQYRRDVHHGLRYWEAATVGIQIERASDLVLAVETALADAEPLRDAREAALALVYSYRSGAAQRAAAAIVEWLGVRAEVAA